MRRTYSILLAFPLIFTIAVLIWMNSNEESGTGTINAVIGDESYIRIYGKEPGKNVPDHVRIRIHLDYVEGILRNRPMDHLTTEQAFNRLKGLDFLRDYLLEEEFPSNNGHPDERRPTFISEDGRICAVGLLIEKTAGRTVAEKVSQVFKYSYIPEIDHPLFLEWTESSGFTIEELAMIQPQYGTIVTEEVHENRNRLGASYGLGSALIAGSNVLYLSNSSHNPWMFSEARNSHWFGLAAGSASVLFGVLNLRNEQVYQIPNGVNLCMMYCMVIEVTETNRLRSSVAAGNIAVGLVSVFRAGYHLLNGTETMRESSSGPGITYLNTHPFDPGSVVPGVSYVVQF